MKRRVCLAQGEPGEEWWEGEYGEGPRVRAQKTTQSIEGLLTWFQSNGKSLEVCEQVRMMIWKGIRLKLSPAIL